MRFTLVGAACALLSVPLAAQNGTFSQAGTGCPTTPPFLASGQAPYALLQSEAWDIVSGECFRFIRSGNDWATVNVGSSMLPFNQPGAQSISLTDNGSGSVQSIPLPFVFSYPGGAGSTNAIEVWANGQVHFEPGVEAPLLPNPGCCNGEQVLNGTDTTGVVVPGYGFLAGPPRVCALATDLRPATGGNVYFEIAGVGSNNIAVVTWDAVPTAATLSPNTVQCQIWDNGEVVVCFGAVDPIATRTALVGISTGNGAVGVPFDPAPQIFLSATGLINEGETFEITANRLSAGASSAALLFSVAGAPPFPLSTIGGPAGCDLTLFSLPSGFPLVPMALGAGEATLPFPIPPGTDGLGFSVQALVLDTSIFPVVPLPLYVSDRADIVVGSPPTLQFVTEGENDAFGANSDYFRLEYAGTGTLDIVKLELDFLNSSNPVHNQNPSTFLTAHFDTNGNFGSSGDIAEGNSGAVNATCTDPNGYGGSDLIVGLDYAASSEAAACEPTATTGFDGMSGPGATPFDYQTLEFEFTDFQPGETFQFDCDCDGLSTGMGGELWGLSVTVTFSDGSTLSGNLAATHDPERAELVLIP